jgi:hypothetical protein
VKNPGAAAGTAATGVLGGTSALGAARKTRAGFEPGIQNAKFGLPS